MTLAPYNPDVSCPKCCSPDVGTQHYPAAAHSGCPLYGQNYIIAQNVSPLAWGTDFYGHDYPKKAEYQQHYRDRMTADEHFDRRCKRCGHGWVEGLPVPTDVTVGPC